MVKVISIVHLNVTCKWEQLILTNYFFQTVIAGMDVTVTAPLDMGAGQQRYVVAYTLKQGIEKQPDILNAQKSELHLIFSHIFCSIFSFIF